MTGEEPGVEPQDAEAIEAFEAALADLAEKLNLLHIAGGSPSYTTIAAASIRPRLTSTGLNEMLAGKRLPSVESLLEFVRVVTTPDDLDKPAAAKFRAGSAVVTEWRGHWQDVKLLQRRAQPANKRVRATVREIYDNAVREAEALRNDAHAEAERIRTNAEADAERIRVQARKDADEITERARETAAVPLPDGPDPQRPGRGVFRNSLLTPGGRRGGALRPGFRPVAAVMAVAGLAVAAILMGDYLTGTPGACREGQTQAADQLVPRTGFQDRGTVRQAAFAAKPEAFLTFPPGTKVPFTIPPPDTSSPTPSTSPTPSPTPTPTPTPSPTPSPSPSKSGGCAKSGS